MYAFIVVPLEVDFVVAPDRRVLVWMSMALGQLVAGMAMSS
jgi:hypothetical protein